MPTKPDPILTTREVAELLKIYYETVLDYIHTGELAAVKRGNRYYIRQSAVDAFLTPDDAVAVPPARRGDTP
jgi:excisionase family DNA binding protein